MTSGVSDLLVLKSTGSAFENFVRDEYTTLVEVNDRIFSTSVDLTYTYAPFAVPQNAVVDAFALSDTLSAEGTAWDGNAVVGKARTATLEVFAQDESASVQVCSSTPQLVDTLTHHSFSYAQATLYKMGQRILAENGGVRSVRISLPNKHYIPVDMKYAGLDNTTPCVVSFV